jgi:RNA polymerase sigma-70 factor (ECF subfamily)
MPDVADDTELARRAGRGDAVAFETLVRRHTDAVWRLARSMLGDDFTAEEAVQDTFLKAHRALRDFRGDSAVRTWLLAICSRVCLDRLRLRRRETVPLSAVGDVAAEGADVADRLHLDRAVRGLAEEERAAFLLVDVLGYNGAEAAAIVGAPATTVRSRLARARERLAAELAPAGAREER